MKLKCTQENLIKGLNIVSHIAGKNVSLPILSNILLSVKDGMIFLISTNLDIGIKTLVRGKIEEEGELTVQAKLLTEYVSLLSLGNIELIKKENNLIIKTEMQKSVINGQAADEYPIIPEVKDVKGINLMAKDFKEVLSQVIFSAAYDDIRPELSGVLFSVDDESLVLVATDSYRLAEKKVEIDEKNEKQIKTDKIIPLRVLHEILRILEENDKKIEIGFSNNQVVFRTGDTIIISRLIEANYPDYKEIIPKEWKTKAICDKNLLIRTIKTASLFSKTGINDVLLEFDKDKRVRISAANVQLGENKSSILAEIEGEKIGRASCRERV